MGASCTGQLFTWTFTGGGSLGAIKVAVRFCNASGVDVSQSNAGQYEYGGNCFSIGWGSCGAGFYNVSYLEAGGVSVYSPTGAAPAGGTHLRFQAYTTPSCGTSGSGFVLPYVNGSSYVVAIDGSGLVTGASGGGPTYTNYVHNFCATNTFPSKEAWELYETNRVGFVTVSEFTMEPGERFCYTETNGIAGVGLFRHNYTPGQEGLEALQTGAGSPLGQPAELNTSTTNRPTAGNIWTSQSSTNRLGTPVDITGSTITRTNVSASTGDTLQRHIEANNDQRQTEMRSLLVAQDRAQGIRDTVTLDAMNRGLENVRSSITGLRDSLEGGTNNAAPGNGTNTTSGAVQAGTSTKASALLGLIPLVTIPEGAAPVLTLPLSTLHGDMEDVEWDFGDATMTPLVTTFRAVELVGFTGLFFVMSLKLFGKVANV